MYIRELFPEAMKALTDGIPKEYLIFGDILIYSMFHLSPIEKEHVDFDDMEICVVIPFGGAFTGGYLSFRWLNIEYKLKPGDMIIFRSCKLLHSVTEVVTGLRQSLVLTSQRFVIEKIKKGECPL